MRLLSTLSALLLAPSVAFAAWGWSDDGSNFVIDTNANLVVKVSKSNGDMISIKYRGVEYNGQSGKNSQVESGLGASTVSIKTYNSNVIKVAVSYGSLRHYLIFRYGNPNVYILMNRKDTAAATASRYIVRIPPGIFTNNEDEDTDWLPANSETIESGDVAGRSGKTWSKHYSGKKSGRTIDYDYISYTNANVGLYMIRSSHEKASGGPFFRSLLRRGGGTGGPDLYEIFQYSMGHTDAFRVGLQGPAVLHFTDNGAAPNSNLFARKADWGWMNDLEMEGWIPASGRGAIAGVGLANMKSGYQYVAALKNAQAQYWNVATGAWRIDGVIPGTYTLTIYKGELEVHTSSVTITAGATLARNTITCSDPEDTASIWRIGSWDGTPKGFLNFDTTPFKPNYMHPSDTRLANWNPANFIIGTTTTNTFPGYMWKDVNNDHIVYFRLTTAQLAAGAKIRFGVTEGQQGGRPTVSVNSWAAALQGDKGQADTRSLTVGTYRGNNYIYEFVVPQSAWVQSTSEYQTLKLSVISGKTSTGWLSPGISIDAIDMIAN